MSAGHCNLAPDTARGCPVSDLVLFEQPYRGNTWRLAVSEHKGRRTANIRKWFPSGGTHWPDKEAGFTIPLDRLADLHDALGEFLAAERNSGGE